MDPQKPDLDWFREFANDVVSQWHDFREFEYLFYGPEARVSLLNAVAKHFFGEMFYSQLDRIVLAVARLTDPPGNGTRRNLSIWALHDEHAVVPGYPSQAFGEAARTATIARAHIAKWRNKRIAHADALAAIDKTDLGQVTPSVLRDFFVACGAYVSSLSEALGNNIFPLDTVAQYGAADLVGHLKLVMAYHDDPERDIVHEHKLLAASKYANA